MALIRNFQENDGVFVFDSAIDGTLSTYDAHHLKTLARVEENHFWFQMRRDKICKTVERYVPKSARILEIGGGTGFVASKIQQLGFKIAMADIHAEGFEWAKNRGISPLYQFDLFNPPFEAEFDVICLFDVLEHLHDPLQAMTCLKRMLKPQGTLILTLPAHMWLWSQSDLIAGHVCRYTKRKLKQLCEQSHLQLVHARYFFTAILPLLFLRKWSKKEASTFDPKISPFLNTLLGAITRSEFYLDRFLPNFAGGSLLAVAKL